MKQNGRFVWLGKYLDLGIYAFLESEDLSLEK